MPGHRSRSGRGFEIGERFTDRLVNAPRRIEIDSGRFATSAVAAAVQIERAFDLAQPIRPRGSTSTVEVRASSRV